MVVYALCIICEARHHNQEAPLYNKMLTSKAPVGPSQDTVGREYRRRLTVSSAEATHILIQYRFIKSVYQLGPEMLLLMMFFCMSGHRIKMLNRSLQLWWFNQHVNRGKRLHRVDRKPASNMPIRSFFSKAN